MKFLTHSQFFALPAQSLIKVHHQDAFLTVSEEANVVYNPKSPEGYEFALLKSPDGSEYALLSPKEQKRLTIRGRRVWGLSQRPATQLVGFPKRHALKILPVLTMSSAGVVSVAGKDDMGESWFQFVLAGTEEADAIFGGAAAVRLATSKQKNTSNSSVDSDGFVTVGADPIPDLESKLVVVFENQRWYPTGWKSKLTPLDPPPWVDSTGVRVLPVVPDSPVPPGWQWEGDWTVDMDAEPHLDKEGWEYSSTFPLRPLDKRFREKKRFTSLVRRRRWMRRRKRGGKEEKVDDDEAPTSGSVRLCMQDSVIARDWEARALLEFGGGQELAGAFLVQGKGLLEAGKPAQALSKIHGALAMCGADIDKRKEAEKVKGRIVALLSGKESIDASSQPGLPPRSDGT